MKAKAIILIALGILGIIFVCTFDITVGKPINDITGAKSIIGIIMGVIFIIIGVRLLAKKQK